MFDKITDKIKLREPVMASKLGHVAHEKISAGKDSVNYGSDATCLTTGRKSEYKTITFTSEIRNLLRRKKSKNTVYAAPTVKGVYNGAYTIDSIRKYAKNLHHYGVFHKERCLLIIEVDPKVVEFQLTANLLYMQTGCKYDKGPGRCRQILKENDGNYEKALEEIIGLGFGMKTGYSTNCNSVVIHLENNRENYEVAYVDEDWFVENDGDVSYLGL